MAVVSGGRPDDRNGTEFLKHLASLRERWALRGAVGNGSPPLCLWIAGTHSTTDGPVRSATANCSGVHLCDAACPDGLTRALVGEAGQLA